MVVQKNQVLCTVEGQPNKNQSLLVFILTSPWDLKHTVVEFSVVEVQCYSGQAAFYVGCARDLWCGFPNCLAYWRTIFVVVCFGVKHVIWMKGLAIRC